MLHTGNKMKHLIPSTIQNQSSIKLKILQEKYSNDIKKTSFKHVQYMYMKMLDTLNNTMDVKCCMGIFYS